MIRLSVVRAVVRVTSGPRAPVAFILWGVLGCCLDVAGTGKREIGDREVGDMI